MSRVNAFLFPVPHSPVPSPHSQPSSETRTPEIVAIVYDFSVN
ncbi:hypothetical protein [Tolypothrix sp. PCC 7910]|nr:hypothetical protein [Tolypothrix sp. PCC 7910]